MESTRRHSGPNQRDGYKHASSRTSSPDQPPVAGLPAAPRDNGADSGNENEFAIWFLEFSNLYNLNLRRPNPSFLVEQAGPSSYYNDLSFYSRLKNQYRRGNGDFILSIFAKDAQDIHSKWVRKPNGGSHVTPSPTRLPRASTEPERASLLHRLVEILDFLSPDERPRHSVAEDSALSNGTRRPKRPSPDGDSDQSPTSKRSRGVPNLSRSASALSRLDSGEVRSSTPLPEATSPLSVRSSQQRDTRELAPSLNSGRSSFISAVFSEPEDHGDRSAFPTTQDTEVAVEEASSQQKLRPSPHTVAGSIAPFSRTAHVLEAPLDERNGLRQDAGQFPMESEPLHDSYSEFSLGSRDLDLRQYDHPAIPTEDVSLTKLSGPIAADDTAFKVRLEDVWPAFPEHLQNAPLAVRWEIMRVALHCGTPMEDIHLQYDPILNDQTKLWDRLRRLSAFDGKSFPEKSKPEAWNAAMSDHFRMTDQIVVLTASLSLNAAKVGPLFKLSLQPLRLDLPHRLDRRFGSDRFLELLIPSSNSKDLKALSRGNESAVIRAIQTWLIEGPHFLLGRVWRSFCIKQATPKKIYKDDTLRPETITILQERIYLFAEDGNDFILTEVKPSISPKLQTTTSHTKMKREHLLEWLLQIQQNEKNRKQSVYKLFSRIALGLSRTRPTAVLQPHQIRHRDEDILSPTGKVMNDGIARMSTALARKIRDILGLDDIPAGYQGRFGSAKGFWLRDAEDVSDEIWIETNPSQRKWVCDFIEEDHRTFEVRNASKELKSATLNLQLLPILEDRAINRLGMKEKVGQFMKDSLQSEMESMKEAMQDPAHFKLWVHENAAPQRRQDRVRLGHVPWSCGLPTSREDQMELLLSQGFDPTKLEFLRKIAYDLRKDKCEELQTRLNVKVGRSTYAYMVVDFSGVLAEDEVHLGFSSKFTDEQSGFSETFLHGMDVLVARTPAHYPSDIQRVKAVFKPELGSLKNVIIFPTKGNIPLADKLSGGDYDGDIAWVCWEPGIVNNFTNAPPPDVPDLFGRGVLGKVSDTYEHLSRSCGSKDVTTEFIDRSFRFNMEPSLLGICTNYKEKLCYSRNSVRDQHAIFMSTLISNLVDRAKQGIVFSEQDWDKQRKILNAEQGDAQCAKKGLDPPQPQYKQDNWRGTGPPTHIIDYVKFVAGKPTVERELERLKRYLGQGEHFDKDLVKFFEYYEKYKRPYELRKKEEEAGKFKKSTWETVLDELQKDIHDLAVEWRNSHDSFEVKRENTYDKWRNIRPTSKVNSKTVQSLCEETLVKVGLSQWDLLKASYLFKLYFNKSPSLPWYVAGYQLAYIKAIAVSRARGAPPVLLTPEMYAGVRPDAKFVRAAAALKDGHRLEQPGEDLVGAEGLSDQDE
ncbi:hypothetical protein F5Y14DRAFT_450706 [Nemania sp. NC0429]|nr:hypothetical protein F5Y14DRAFT_450706 [Nemania sp. NC0429]